MVSFRTKETASLFYTMVIVFGRGRQTKMESSGQRTGRRDAETNDVRSEKKFGLPQTTDDLLDGYLLLGVVGFDSLDIFSFGF